MDFLDEVIDTAQKAGEFIYDKAGNAVDYVSLEYKSAALRSKIDDLYKTLGKLVYKSEITRKDVEPKKQEVISKINELSEELSELSKKMSRYKNVCENCGKVNSGKADFCAKCGHSLR